MSDRCSRCNEGVDELWAEAQRELSGTIRGVEIEGIVCKQCWDSSEMEAQEEFLQDNPDLQADLEVAYDIWVDSLEKEEQWRQMVLPEKIAIRDEVFETFEEMKKEGKFNNDP